MTTQAKHMPSVTAIRFIGEEAADWAAHQPAIGPANDARVKTVLLAGHWLQDNAKLVAQAPALLEALQALLSNAENLVRLSNSTEGWPFDKARAAIQAATKS